MKRPPATVSVDMDPVDLHLAGYGVRGLAADPLVYGAALPRLIERFARFGVRATFFVVARDAGTQGATVARLSREGHEVASHSLTHPLALTRLPAEELTRELVESRALLARAAGEEIAGFRAPNFDLDARVLRGLARAGYRYDASGYPTPMLLTARLLLAARSGDPRAVLRMRPWPRSFVRHPHRLDRALGGLAEFPTAVTPRLRLPVYHTMRFFSARAPFLRRLEGFAARGEPLSYPLHAVDALGLAEDGVDARLARHPGMALPLEEKLAALDDVLRLIATRFEPAPFRDRLDRGEIA